MSCQGKVVLVTGASRGVGRGIAIACAKEGAAVIITGRHKAGRSDHLTGGLDATAAEIAGLSKFGGTCMAMTCDHDDDAQTQKVVNEIFKTHGRIDVLVNNAFSGADFDGDINATRFWEKPLTQWDQFHRVGLRSHYVASSLCARHWVPNKQQALIVNISSAAGAAYVFDVAYGVGKNGVDRLTADTARELNYHGITVVSIYPGAVATEVVNKGKDSGNSTMTDRGLFEQMESVEFSGRGVAALAADPNKMRFSGKVLMTPELAEMYGFTDVNGAVPWGKDNFLKMIRKMMGGPPSQWKLSKANKPAAKL